MPGEEAEAQHSLRHSSLSSPFCSINILQESHQTLSNTHVSLTGIQDLTESISHHLLQWHVLRKEWVNHGKPAKSGPPPAFVNNLLEDSHTHWFAYCLRLPSLYKPELSSCNINLIACQAENVYFGPFSERVFRYLCYVFGPSTGNIADAQYRAVE